MSGCGSDVSSVTSGLAGPKRTASSRPAVASSMVAAVSPSKAGPPVQLKFEMQQRPVVGQPVDIDFELVPTAPNLDSVSARFQAEDGLELVSGSNIPEVDKPADGTPIHHRATLVAKRDGIFSLTAVVTVDSPNQSLTRHFSIPVIAGEGLPELAAKSEVAEGRTGAAPAPGSGSKAQ